QFLCSGIAHRFPGSKILFVGLARDISNQLRRIKPYDWQMPVTYKLPEHPNITITHPLKLLPNSLAFGRNLNQSLMRAHVRRIAKEIKIKTPVLWLNPHYAVHMIGCMGECAALYDITDDWTAMTQSSIQTCLTIQQDATLCRRADAVIVC